MPTHYQGTEAEKRALEAFIKLHRASESVMNAAKDVYQRAGLTDSQFAVLEALFHLGPQDQQTIGRKILKTRGNITMIVGNLEKEGYVMRAKDAEDGRRYSVNLTAKGHALIEKIFPDHARLVVDVMSVLTKTEQVELARLCKKLGLAQ